MRGRGESRDFSGEGRGRGGDWIRPPRISTQSEKMEGACPCGSGTAILSSHPTPPLPAPNGRREASNSDAQLTDRPARRRSASEREGKGGWGAGLGGGERETRGARGGAAKRGRRRETERGKPYDVTPRLVFPTRADGPLSIYSSLSWRLALLLVKHFRLYSEIN